MAQESVAGLRHSTALSRASQSIFGIPPSDLSPDANEFLEQFVNGLDEEEITVDQVDAFVPCGAALWAYGADRAADEILVRTRQVEIAPGNGPSRTVLEIVSPDLAFLVGSVLADCSAIASRVLLTLHPIVDTRRSPAGQRTVDGTAVRESYVQIHMSQLDEAAEARLCSEVRQTIADVKAANQDFDAMRQKMIESAELIEGEQRFDPEMTGECVDFLRWLVNENFTFLGVRDLTFPRLADGSLQVEEPDIITGSNLGVLRDETRYVLHRGNEPTVITPEIEAFLNEPTPIIVSKSNMRSRVHRRVYTDYVGIKRYDGAGRVIGERRFVGLFTADAFNRLTRDVPLVRRRVAEARAKAGKRRGGHDDRALQNIFETFPREELFQISTDELVRIAMGILKLEEHPKPKLFVRRDRFDRYVSVLVFVPREVFNSDLRARIGEALCTAYNGRLSTFYPSFSDAPLARIHYIIGLEPDHPEPEIADLEATVTRLARTWSDGFVDAVQNSDLSDEAKSGCLLFAKGFNAAYRDAFSTEEAVRDITEIAALSADNPIALRAYRLDGDEASVLRAKIYTRGEAIPLSDCVPIFENMGLFVRFETGYPIKPSAQPVDDAPDTYWVHDVKMRSDSGDSIDLPAIRAVFENAFTAIWTKKTDSDGFNRLILLLGASWREAALFRVLARYRKQTGFDPAQGTQIEALCRYPAISKCLLDLFKTRFDPATAKPLAERSQVSEALSDDIRSALDDVPSLDHDRVLRRLKNLILAIQRTNFFQTDPGGMPHDYITLKIASGELDALPLPRPYREIFVWAPHVEGIHLRFGPVARGGLRWSDRRDDFRTEVLGLVKAQQVKNAVIVPVGSKGGFYPKSLPVGGSREEIREEGIRAYKTFITGMLELTDNLTDQTVTHPEDVVCWDGDDPYLVVAADKGTATFSDIANEISESHGYWLGDAFASGGSAGYDHKKMGITARGGWVAVQRHFREIGVDIQEDPITVIGVGDMSGDVFGNGMLLSKEIRLVAAFNHQHIFIDPDPQDAHACWEERKRLFDLPRSTWEDYARGLISSGGGIWSRSVKSITLTPEVKKLTGLMAEAITPSELIHAILKSKADLLWFGGIGTYVKSKDEAHVDVGDKTNDALRVNASELQVQVVGEGANLGITQAGRVEFARRGGRINTDAVDNSAGVDSSDHEVNIKILLSKAIRRGDLSRGERNSVLASMTDDVADHVLANNYSQTAALTVAHSNAAQDLDAHERFMERLESRNLLDRSVEGLPTAEEIRSLREQGLGLTRPEISVLLAYAKNSLFSELIASDVPDDPHFEATLRNYFPPRLHSLGEALKEHELRREIIATYLANRIVNLGGPTFVHRVRESAEAETPAIAKAFEAARVLFNVDAYLKEINSLDNTAPASVQTDLKKELILILRRQTFWLARTRSLDAPIADTIDRYQPGLDELSANIGALVSDFERERIARRASSFAEDGAPDGLAQRAARLRNLASATDIIDLAKDGDVPVLSAARLYHGLGDQMRFDELRAAANDASTPEHWDRLATRRLIEELMRQQADTTRTLIRSWAERSDITREISMSDAADLTSNWLTEHSDAFDRLKSSILELSQSGTWTFAKLVLVSDSLRHFMFETGVGRAT